MPTDKKKLILSCPLCPGDVLTLTVALHSLHEAYPGEYQTDVRTMIPDIWLNNPHVTELSENDADTVTIHMEYPQINRSNQTPINFISCYTEFLGEQIGRPLYARSNKPLIYLSDDEKSWLTMLQEHYTDKRKTPYAVVVAGSKPDYTAKQWPVEYYQEVIDRTLGDFQWVQIGEEGHNHERLERCISVLGKTTHRMLHRLVYHASIGLGPVTYLAHLCAAFEKPYVYLAGGREPVTWLNYPKQHTLHTIGMLSCCRDNACWKSRIIKLADNDAKDFSLCEQPVIGPKIPVAKCMAMITPDEVVPIIKKYARMAV